MIRFTILDDTRNAVMPGATAAMALLPLISLPTADPYQPARVLLAAVAALVIAGLARPVALGRAGRYAVWAAAALLVWMAVAAVLSQPSSSVFGVHGRYQGLVALAAAIASGGAGLLAGQRYVRWLLAGAAAASAVVTLSLLSQRAAGSDVVATMGNPVIAGAWLAVSASTLLAGAYAHKGRWRWMLLGIAAAASFGVGVTGSRGALIGLIAGAIVASLPLVMSRRLGWLPAVSVLAVLAVLGLLVAAPTAVQKFSLGDLSSGSAASRYQIWRGAAALIADNPVFGVGPGRFLYEFPRYQPFEYATLEGGDTRPDQAHSQALQMAAESGLPAVMAAGSLVIVVWLGAAFGIRCARAASLIGAAGFAAFLAQGLFGVPSAEVSVLGWCLGGIVLAGEANSGGLPSGQASSRESVNSEARSGVLGDRMAGGHAAWRMLRSGVVALATVSLAATALFLVGDYSHREFQQAYSRGDFVSALVFSDRAVQNNGLVDVYRVAYSDAALYSGGAAVSEAVAVVERGLRLEPRSYDLALARARLLAASGAESGRVANAYLYAVDCWPQGIQVRREAAEACRKAGLEKTALELENGVRILVEAQGGEG